MIELIYQLGGKKDFLILLIITTILFLVNCLIKSNTLRIIIALLCSLFIVAQTFSLYSTQSFIGYQFYVHANLRGVLGIGNLFIKQIIILTILFSFLSIINFKSYSITRIFFSKISNFKILRIISISMIFFLLVSITMQGDFISDSKTLLPLLKTNNLEGFNKTLEKYQISDYVTPEK